MTLGYVLSTPPQQEEPVPEVTPEVTLPDPSLPPRSAGEWGWKELRSGECLAEFDSVWQESFALSPCTAPHAAEFVRAELLDRERDAPYPGDRAIREAAQELCDRWERNDLRGGDAYDDLVVVPGYSLGRAVWESGDRVIACVVYRAEGGLITSPLVR